MKFRLYKPEDEARVKETFAAQGINVNLPLPGHDPAVIVAVVGEGEKGAMAVIGRLTVEAHLIVHPEEPGAAAKVRTLAHAAEGALIVTAERMRQLGFAAVDDLEAFVPVKMDRMQDLIRYLGFMNEPVGYVKFWKKVGE